MAGVHGHTCTTEGALAMGIMVPLGMGGIFTNTGSIGVSFNGGECRMM